jgi:hypothetical protein
LGDLRSGKVKYDLESRMTQRKTALARTIKTESYRSDLSSEKAPHGNPPVTVSKKI